MYKLRLLDNPNTVCNLTPGEIMYTYVCKPPVGRLQLAENKPYGCKLAVFGRNGISDQWRLFDVCATDQEAANMVPTVPIWDGNQMVEKKALNKCVVPILGIVIPITPCNA